MVGSKGENGKSGRVRADGLPRRDGLPILNPDELAA
jgi:hypothetical protein